MKSFQFSCKSIMSFCRKNRSCKSHLTGNVCPNRGFPPQNGIRVKDFFPLVFAALSNGTCFLAACQVNALKEEKSIPCLQSLLAFPFVELSPRRFGGVVCDKAKLFLRSIEMRSASKRCGCLWMMVRQGEIWQKTSNDDKTMKEPCSLSPC